MYNLQDDLLKIENDFNKIQLLDKDSLRIKMIEEFNPTGEYKGIKALTYEGYNYGKFVIEFIGMCITEIDNLDNEELNQRITKIISDIIENK